MFVAEVAVVDAKTILQVLFLTIAFGNTVFGSLFLGIATIATSATYCMQIHYSYGFEYGGSCKKSCHHTATNFH